MPSYMLNKTGQIYFDTDGKGHSIDSYNLTFELTLTLMFNVWCNALYLLHK